ncbi:rhodanese-like domain-containing protein [Ligilactobacillus cholophilus]|uniref:rhodanese-like domain-containing protein n=1 Tax=Ligilactobacillus cholophilus TaxID=3050131 RepID=UPI0025AEF0C0|nr:rhodanese-like domain-containing protein [Ligilactobacillus cholophilus]
MLLGKTNSVLFWVDLILIIILAWIIINQIVIFVRSRRAAKLIDNETLKENMHHAQIVDVREEDSFKAGHILGARNIPFSQFKLYMSGLRKDMPIYLYEQGKALSLRCAIMLKKAGYNNIFVLKGGYNKWDGKKKK